MKIFLLDCLLLYENQRVFAERLWRQAVSNQCDGRSIPNGPNVPDRGLQAPQGVRRQACRQVPHHRHEHFGCEEVQKASEQINL